MLTKETYARLKEIVSVYNKANDTIILTSESVTRGVNALIGYYRRRMPRQEKEFVLKNCATMISDLYQSMIATDADLEKINTLIQNAIELSEKKAIQKLEYEKAKRQAQHF